MPDERLNDRQVAVLRRICQEEDPVTSADSALAHSVYALRRRGLVTTVWVDGRWTAAPTPAGHQRLARAAAPASSPARRAGELPPDTAPATSPPMKPPAHAAAARLIADIEYAGGVLRVTDPPPAERARLRRALHAARASGLLPPGHHLSHTGRDKGDLVIRLLAGQPQARPLERPVSVPVNEDLPATALHTVVRACRLPVCPDCEARARRILHALAVAADGRGMTIDPAPQESRASLVITVHDTLFPLVLREGAVEIPDTESLRYPWQRVTRHTTKPSHLLDLSLAHDWAHRGRRYQWGDRRRWRLEDKLPQVLSEIEQRAEINRDRQAVHEQKERETRYAWHRAIDQARRQLLDTHRRDHLREQIEAWQEAARVRSYCDALQHHLARTPATEADTHATLEWITWARSYADGIDPLAASPRAPAPPEITPEALRPFLYGWSPYKPERR